MSSVEWTPAAAHRLEAEPVSRWILHPWLDPLLLAFPWLPVYLFAVLFLGDHQLAQPRLDEARLFLVALFAANFAHRNYTYLLVFGDRDTFHRRPALFLAILAIAFGLGALGSFDWVPGLMSVLLVVIVVWNLQHVVMQRYGFLRMYAWRQQGGVESDAHARRDLWLVWSFVLLVLSAWLFTGDPRYEYFAARLAAVAPWSPPFLAPLPWISLAVCAPLFLWSASRWLRHERLARAEWTERLPRWVLLASTVPLYAIALVHDIFLAFLCVMWAHAVEYVSFVHAHCRSRFRESGWREGWAVPLLKSASLSFAVLGVGGFLFYSWVVSGYPKTSGWVGLYLTGTVLVHFSFDGLIWHRKGRADHSPRSIEAPQPVR